MQLIHVVVDALVHRLDATGNDHLSMELFSFVFADQPFQLMDQFRGLFIGYELSGLNRVHQEL